MNFFEHQEKARSQSRWIIVAFILVTLAIVLAVDLVVLLLFGAQPLNALKSGNALPVNFSNLFSLSSLTSNTDKLLGSSLVTGGVIGLASLGKIVSLRSGGGKVARDMGGVLVTPDTKDPLRRRFHNVVEEIALASGVPVPEIYVMENEPGINAFAAGYTSADAAVAVTQGTLEKLNRSELQGVIAHEFSHIFNGDMRINIRMMGIIFGIMVIAILGRKFMYSGRYNSSSSRDGASGTIAIGLGLMLVGYIGLFFARWMKSALSRQREYLADASAVQFTRDPDGIGGALKKIAAYNHHSYLKTDTEEVSHMLFGSGHRSLMFATHPPIEKRIERIEKNFSAQDIERLAQKLAEQERLEHIQAELARQEQEKPSAKPARGGIFDAQAMIDNIGNPEFERILGAALLASSIPEDLTVAAHSLEWAPEVVFYCLLSEDPTIRRGQLRNIKQEMGNLSEQKINQLIDANVAISHEHRLPLLEICFPALKRRPTEELEKILGMVEVLMRADNRIDSFEYLLSRLIRMHLQEASDPKSVKLHGNRKISSCIAELSTVVSTLAAHGYDINTSQGIQYAQHAYKEGMNTLDIHHTNLTFIDDWQDQLDEALDKLNQLKPTEKNKVVQTLAATVTSDKKLVTAEHEMLRVICAKIHVPLPMLKLAEQV